MTDVDVREVWMAIGALACLALLLEEVGVA